MLDLIHQSLAAIATPALLPRTTVPAILVLVHIALPTATGVEVLVAFAGAHGGLRNHVFGGDWRTSIRAALSLEGGRVAWGWDHVACAAAASAVLCAAGFAGDAFADNACIGVGRVVFADVAGACGASVY